ncbi:TPA: amino acid permease [Klebsiella pneumoniae]|mgnify:CR=1 FL=1|uniref:amino acid permease n=1 Tax=Enterobacteriaceae TaxID=543 RepID=UPI002072A849|nr:MULTISPECIES: amino acid permease [Enterobacter]HBQ1079193.1 transporter [Klebsiella pneumoniae]MCW4756606.1 amino acid permease [Enterobacter hormaechei]HBU9459766.1 transporter [Klebsiella pneumoniae]HBV7394882.1 transporter [Klebsiella pneumoniae]HBV7575954.1 transporter [Klebsiella pneumoniae]
MTINSEHSAIKYRIPFTTYDLGWVVLCIGMAIGAGIIYMPIQAGVKGIWVFVASIGLSYPAVYWLQDLYLKTLTQTQSCDSYAEIITQYLGKNWGGLLGIAYFLMLLMGILNYAMSLVNDSATYLHSYHITEGFLSKTIWYPFILLAVMVLIANQGEKWLFRIAGPMIFFKVAVIVFLGIVMVPFWSFNNISAFPPVLSFLRDVLLTLPFTLFSILFVQILNPMNIAYRKVEADPVIASLRAIRATRIAYIVLVVSVLFFAFSFSFAITKEEAASALAQNISALALASQIMPGNLINILSVTLNIFAILTAFFSIYLGFKEAIVGLAVNMISRISGNEDINRGLLSKIIAVAIVVFLWIWVRFDFSVMLLMQIAGPVFGLVACLIPFYLVKKVSALENLRAGKNYYVAFYGMLLCISPFLKFVE